MPKRPNPDDYTLASGVLDGPGIHMVNAGDHPLVAELGLVDEGERAAAERAAAEAEVEELYPDPTEEVKRDAKGHFLKRS